jgi:uncharacterized protein YjbI with pentapeptide repeats
MKSPRSFADLPFADGLSQFPASGSLEIDGEYDLVRFDGGIMDSPVAGGSRFTECAFTGVTLDGGRLRKSRLSDVWFGETRFVATDLAETSVTGAWFAGCVLAGLPWFASQLRRVKLRSCKLDSVNFRDTLLNDVVFEDCVLHDVDFGGAKLTKVRFPGCTMARADFTNVTCSDVDLRGAKLENGGIKAGYGALNGARIDSIQLITLAPLLARHLGITVDDA